MLRSCFFVLLLMASMNAWSGDISYKVGVNGLTCPFCTYGIEKHLLKLGGVEGVETNIDEGYVLVTMDEGELLEKPEVERAVKKAGFSLRSFE